MINRLNNEINKVFPELREKHNNIIPNIRIPENSYNQEETETNVSCIELYDKTPLLYINFPKEYPFRPPIVSLNASVARHNNTTNYDFWAIDFTKAKTNKELEMAYIFTIIRQPLSRKYISQIPNSKTCFCCNTILCMNNWSPFNNIFNISMEYLSRDIFRSYLNPLRYRQMYQIFVNDRWSLCQELLFCIISHL